MPLPAPSPESTALVTGASAGIGGAIARELARRGHGVTLVARREERLRALADDLARTSGIRAEAVTCDLADDAARRDMLEEVESRGLRIDVLVNNAGFGSSGPFHEQDVQREVSMARTNVEAVVALCGACLGAMVTRGQGAVLNVASISGFQPLPGEATYAASKAFVLSFSEALHTELRGSGVGVTALCPGPTHTEFFESGAGQAAQRMPEIAWDSAEDVARAGVDGMEAGRRVVLLGPWNKLSAHGGRVMPRSVLLPALRRSFLR